MTQLGAVSSADAVTTFDRAFKALSDQMTTVVERFSKVAERGPYILLTSLGSAMLIVALFAKLNVFTYRPFDIRVAEFITMELLGAVLLLAGCWLKFYEFRARQLFLQEQQRVYAEMAARTSSLAQAATEAVVKGENHM